jgi:undecaprenyl diphosphate synthase
LLEQMRWAEELTGANTTITLFVAFNYGGRAEILDAAKRFQAKRVAQSAAGRGGELGSSSSAAGPLSSSQSEEEEFRRCLYAPEMHDPDLIIRTSGERRLSNYLLWQSAYSELVFREELWPDFTREALEQSLAEFSARRRRFGGR